MQKGLLIQRRIMQLKVVTFGEIMMRLSTPGFERFVQSESFDVTYGGGEANVAVALSNYGLDAVFVSKVPDNALGQAVITTAVRGSETINTSDLPKGIYFVKAFNQNGELVKTVKLVKN